MAKTLFGDFKNLVRDSKDQSFDGFSLSADDPRDLAENLENGVFDNIDLYGTGFEANSGLGDRLTGFLQGRDVGVYAQGKKLAETTITGSDLRVGGSRETIKFSDTVKKLEDRDFPVDSGTLDDLFQATGVKELNFKPVSSEKFKEKAEQVAESENVELFTKLVKPLGAVATLIGLVLTIRRLK